MSTRFMRRVRRLPLVTAVTAFLITGTIALPAPAQADTPAPTATAPPTQPATATRPGEQEKAQPPAAPPAAEPTGAAAEAITEAQRSGNMTPIPSLTDEYSTTAAKPDGSFITTYSSGPERVKQNGTWTQIDTTLVERSDGSYGPKAALADVSFGAGGSTSLVSFKRGGNALKFTWPGKLPKPIIIGDTATYPSILPDVDLQVTANATGYSSIFVVKTAKAAANPAVRKLDVGLTGTRVKIAGTRGGGAEATDAKTGKTVFTANTALMWDSTPASNSTAGVASGADPLSSPQAAHEAAGLLGGHRAQVKIGLGKGKQTLTLDRALLTAKTTKYPVFVDPDWSVWSGNPSQLAWARISSNGWNVYKSTATSGAYSARIGYDDWDGGAGEKARTYYQMNTSGIKGATIKSAYLNVTERWAASCSKTAAVVYATSAVSGFDPSHLYWGHEPTRGALLATVYGQETGCGTSSPAVSPASLQFDVTSNIKSAAAGKWNSAHFLVEAKDMSDKYSWKQLGYKGGARMSIQYSYRPTLAPADGKQHVFPSATDQGKTVTTTRTPTLSWRASNKFPNGVVRNLMVDYHVLDKTGKLVAYGYGPGANSYSLNGTDWTVTPALPADGEYTWVVTAKNQDGLWAPAWGPPQKFTVDTIAPKPPTVRSAQFPPGQIGGAFSDKGTFVLGNDRSNNVTGYLFTLDGDLANITYANNKGTAWTTTTTLQPKTVYYAKADNAGGTGTVVLNGTAAVGFAPGTAGAHRVFAKAVDQAGSTSSSQTIYEFNAGKSTPTYVYGDKMISGWTATNADGTSAVVPKATTTSKTGQLVAQPNYAGNYYADGYQAMLGNLSSTSKVVNGDTATFWFDIPQNGLWEIGANLTTGVDYGMYSLTLDQGTATQAALTSADFDAYSPFTATRFVNFGIVKNSTGAQLVLPQGVHSITLKLTGTNAKSTGYQAGIDVLRLAPTLICTIDNTKDCLNNKAISTYTSGTTPTVTTADADGWGYSLDADDFKAGGWTPGSTVTVDGARVKLPSTFGDGKDDNMLAAGQLITVPASGVTNKGNALVFLGLSVNGNTTNATGRITYAQDSRCSVSTQAYTMDWVADWAWAPIGGTVLTLPHRNTADGHHYVGVSPSVMAVSVPLVCPDTPVTSVSLPLVANTVSSTVTALHILGLGVRPTSSTSSGDSALRWVGSWAAAQDTGTVQALSGTTSVNATLNNQTVRIPAHLSTGTGTDPGRVRVRLANSLGKTPVTFDAASIALQDTTAAGATPAGAPLPLTFAGATSVTLPAGTDVTSDPVALTAPDQATVLVSLKVHGSVTSLSGHLDAKNPVYASPSDSIDHTQDTDGAGFPASTMTGLPFLSGLDVSTPTDNPVGALVLYGDQSVNSDTAAPDGLSHLSDNLATVLATDDDGATYPIQAGVLNLGSSSWGNKYLLPGVPNGRLPQNAFGMVDREILNQSNARIVLVAAGTSDLLTCADTTTADSCASAVEDKLVALASQLQQYRADDAPNAAVNVPTTNRTLKVYVATLPPFNGAYTALQENARQLVNAYILGSGGPATMNGYADGVIDFAAAVSSTGEATGAAVKPEDLSTASDGKSYPNNSYYQDLARQYVLDADSVDGIVGAGEPAVDPNAYPVGVWKFDEGSGAIAHDTGAGTGSAENPQRHDATLTNVTWAPLGRQADSKAGTFNGANSYVNTQLDLNTGKSFTVSAWVRLADKSADRTFFTRPGSNLASLYIQYDKADDKWRAYMPSATSGDAITYYKALSDAPAKAGVWTHVAAVYDSTVNGLELYVNGVPQGRADEVTAFNELGQTSWIGRSGASWFSGDISDVKVWERVVTEQEIAYGARPKSPMVDWEFEDQSLPTTAVDSADKANGAFAGGVTWKSEGHPSTADSDGWDTDWGAVTLDGTTGAVDTRARLRSDQSFTVAGWVRLTNGNRDVTAVSQAGVHSSGLQLAYGTNCTCWKFVLPQTDSTDPTSTTVQDPAPATIGTWTHLAGVYDASTDTATLYVNGTKVASLTTPTPPWNSTGQFMAGRTWWNDTYRNYFTGDIDDVLAFQEALSDDNIGSLMNEQPLQN